MKYSRKDYLKIFAILMSTVLLYLSIKELRVALTGSPASAQTAPCSTPTPTPSPSPSATPSPTPSASPPPPTPVPTGIVHLTEFMACPASGNEWLELYNASNTPIEVINWQIIDAANNKRTLSGTIAPNSFATFQWTGSLLNNTGDSFSVFTATGQVIALASYETCSSGISFVYENGEWVGALPTPEAKTEVSENSATAAARLLASSATNLFTTAQTSLADSSLPLTSTTNSQHTPSLPYKLPASHTSPPTTTQPPTHKNTSSQQAKSSTAPAVSVILGGLLQLLSGSYAIYDAYIKQHV